MKRILPEVDIAVYGVQVNQRPTSGLHHGGSQYVHEALSFDGEEVEGFFFFLWHRYREPKDAAAWQLLRIAMAVWTKVL